MEKIGGRLVVLKRAGRTELRRRLMSDELQFVA